MGWEASGLLAQIARVFVLPEPSAQPTHISTESFCCIKCLRCSVFCFWFAQHQLLYCQYDRLHLQKCSIRVKKKQKTSRFSVESYFGENRYRWFITNIIICSQHAITLSEKQFERDLPSSVHQQRSVLIQIWRSVWHKRHIWQVVI